MVDCDFINFIIAVLSIFCTVSVHRFVVSLCCTRRVLIGLKIHVTSGRPRFRGGGKSGEFGVVTRMGKGRAFMGQPHHYVVLLWVDGKRSWLMRPADDSEFHYSLKF